MKPHLKLADIKGKSPVDAARERHGKPFSHEKGSKWRPHEVPVLTAWMQGRGKK